MTFLPSFSPFTAGRSSVRWLVAAAMFAACGSLRSASVEPQETYGFITSYVTTHNTWGLTSSYTDTLLVLYNVYTKPEGVLVYTGLRAYVPANGLQDTFISSVNYNIVVTDIEKNVPQITSALELALQINRPITYQIVATKNPTSFGASGLPDGLGVDPNTGLISGAPTGTGAFSVALAASGAGGVGLATLKITVVDPPAFFDGSDYIPDDVYYLPFPGGTFFGLFTYEFYPYLYHYDLGFVYPFDANDAPHGVYLYDFASQTFWYTNPGLFPYLYDFTRKSFLYYFPDNQRPGHYTTNPRYFYDFAARRTITK